MREKRGPREHSRHEKDAHRGRGMIIGAESFLRAIVKDEVKHMK